MSSLSDALLRPTIVALVSLFVFYILYCLYDLNRTPKHLRNLPWLGKPKGPFATLRATYAGTFNNQALCEEGYEKYSRNGQPFVLSSAMTGKELVLPPSDIPWVLSQSDSDLNGRAVQEEFIQGKYTMPSSQMLNNPIQGLVVSRDLTRKLGQLSETLNDEISATFADIWGTDTENWNEVNVYKSVLRIVARASNRILIGSPLCRDETFLYHANAMAQSIGAIGTILRLFPEFLKPIVGPLLHLIIAWHHKKCRGIISPMIRERLAQFKAHKADPEAKTQAEPNDMVQWFIHLADECPNPEIELDADILTLRILALIFAAVHTSSFATTQVIYDLASSPPEKNFIEMLKAECESVLAEDDGVWTKNGLARMYKVDSALRESQRANGLGTGGLSRKVLNPKGITLSNGIHVPFGYRISFTIWGIHHDPDDYTNPFEYNPLRYADLREEYQKNALVSQQRKQSGESDEKAAQADILKVKNLSMVTTSEKHLPFSHGKHACPGRFFAANELKLILAHMIMNYELEHLPKRPQSVNFCEVIIPSFNGKLKIKRRAGTV